VPDPPPPTPATDATPDSTVPAGQAISSQPPAAEAPPTAEVPPAASAATVEPAPADASSTPRSDAGAREDEPLPPATFAELRGLLNDDYAAGSTPVGNAGATAVDAPPGAAGTTAGAAGGAATAGLQATAPAGPIPTPYPAAASPAAAQPVRDLPVEPVAYAGPAVVDITPRAAPLPPMPHPVPPVVVAAERRRGGAGRALLLALVSVILVAAVFGAAGYALSQIVAQMAAAPGPLITASPVPVDTPSPSSSQVAAVTPTSSAAAGGSPTPTAIASTPGTSASPTPSASPLFYTVKRGDTLRKIAARFGVTVEAIATANGITNLDNIALGRRLIIPRP
jgi:LysM repeat protein